MKEQRYNVVEETFGGFRGWVVYDGDCGETPGEPFAVKEDADAYARKMNFKEKLKPFKLATLKDVAKDWFLKQLWQGKRYPVKDNTNEK